MPRPVETDLNELAEIAISGVGENLFSDVDHLRHGVMTRDGEWRYLTPKQWRAFDLLYRNRENPVRSDRLAAAVWPAREPEAENIRRQLICDLRRALAGSRYQIRTWNLAPTSYELIID